MRSHDTLHQRRPEMRNGLLEPQTPQFRRIVGTLLEVERRGYWEPPRRISPSSRQDRTRRFEDRIEGVTAP